MTLFFKNTFKKVKLFVSNGALYAHVLRSHLKNEKNSVTLVSHRNCDLQSFVAENSQLREGSPGFF